MDQLSKRFRVAAQLAAALGVLLVLGACGPEPLDTPTFRDPGEPGDQVVGSLLVVTRDEGRSDAVQEQLAGQVNELRLVDVIESRDRNFENLEQVLATPVMQAVDQSVVFFALDGIGLDQALNRLSEEGLADEGVAPVHRVAASGHWGAFPGTQPVPVDAQSWKNEPKDAKVDSQRRVIGIIDTGIANGSPNAIPVDAAGIDVHYPICEQALHGEAVASAIRQVNPRAEVFSANAFPSAANCWVTNEIDVLIATSLLQLFAIDNGIEYDAVNFSLGATGYHTEDDEDAKVTYPPILLKLIIGSVPAVVAAGNTLDDRPIFPAANVPPLVAAGSPFDITAVFAADPGGEATVWDDSGAPVPPVVSVDQVAPGCALILQGMSDGSGGLDESRVVIWGGSSFASPIYAALGRDVFDDVNASDLYAEILPPRMNNNASDLYPSAPTDC